MNVILVYVVLLGVVRVALPRSRTFNSIFCFSAAFSLWLIASFRSQSFGPDTPGYIDYYRTLPGVSLTGLWTSLIQFDSKDPFFYLTAKLLSDLGLGPQGWLALLSAVAIFGFAFLVSRFSDGKFFSFLIFVGLGYLYFSFTGLRQATALGITFFAVARFLKQRTLSFVALTLLAALFHLSAVVVLAAYVLKRYNLSKLAIPIAAGAFLVANNFASEVRGALAASGIERIETYSGFEQALNNTGFIIHACILLFCLVFMKPVLRAQPNFLVLFNFLIVGLAFQAMSIVVGEFFRVAMYFNVYACVLVPAAIKQVESSKLRFAFSTALTIALITYMLVANQFRDFSFQ